MSKVEFDEDKDALGTRLTSPQPRTALDSLLKSGFVSNYNQAAFVLLLIAAFLIFGAYYVARNTFPPEPVLGPDVLLPGEVVPSNRNI